MRVWDSHSVRWELDDSSPLQKGPEPFSSPQSPPLPAVPPFQSQRQVAIYHHIFPLFYGLSNNKEILKYPFIPPKWEHKRVGEPHISFLVEVINVLICFICKHKLEIQMFNVKSDF